MARKRDRESDREIRKMVREKCTIYSGEYMEFIG